MRGTSVASLLLLGLWGSCSSAPPAGPETPAPRPSTAGGTDGQAATSVADAALTVLQERVDATCQCEDAACLDALNSRFAGRVTDEDMAAIEADRAATARHIELQAREKQCIERVSTADGDADATVSNAPPPDNSELIARLEDLRNEVCLCRKKTSGEDCVDKAQRKLERMVAGLPDETLLGVTREQFERILVLANETRECYQKINKLHGAK